MDGPSPRILKEVQKNMVEPVPGVTKLEFDPENYRHFLIEIEGPKESLYEGGKFKLQMLLPDDYPMAPPKMTFKTNIYHPYIDPAKGLICLEILDPYSWSPALQFKHVLSGIVKLLRYPEAGGHYNQVAAQHWRKDKKEAEEMAREYTEKYATQS